MRTALLLVLILSLAACAKKESLTLIPSMQGTPDASYRTFDPQKRHHRHNGYQNAGDFKPTPGAGWRHLVRDPFSKQAVLPAGHVLSKAQVSSQLKGAAKSPISVTWIGHATMLIRVGSVWILTDPFFGHRASPWQAVGPSRSVAPAIDLDELPPIDVVLVSHNHYDHYDGRAMRALAKLNPDTIVMTPLDNGALAKRAGFKDARPLDWFGSDVVKGLTITSVPAVHSSRRGLLNVNEALWSGWSIKMASGGPSIYFSGDTGYGSFGRDIREKLGSQDIAIVPIGAYDPAHIEGGFHTTPEEAVQLAKDVGASHIIPMHWGTIALTKEPFHEQRDRYLKASKGMKGAHLLAIGETMAFRRR